MRPSRATALAVYLSVPDRLGSSVYEIGLGRTGAAVASTGSSVSHRHRSQELRVAIFQMSVARSAGPDTRARAQHRGQVVGRL